MKPSILSFACRIIVMTFFLMGLNLPFAAGVEFISKEKFLSEKSPYKDLPVRILFKKLSESQGDEKRQIRSLIILKQVFEHGLQEQEKDRLVKYKRTYGIIKELNLETLKVSAAETGQDVSYHVGIDGIPVENPKNYDITVENAGRYAAIIYTLDERLYKIEIGFLIAEPSGLSLKRSGENNVISWNSPVTVQKPSGYQVFINDRLFKTVDDPVAGIPRAKGNADVYKIKAVYKHGSGVIVSAASDELQDHITLAEINRQQQEKLAAGKYALVIAALKPGEWEKAKNLLYENQALFTANLAKSQQEEAAALAVFFNRIDEGDRLISISPETVDALDKAISAYDKAQKRAGGIDLSFIREEKIKTVLARKDALKTKKQEQLAEGKYALVIAALKPGEWEKAKNLLYENQALFTANLAVEQRNKAAELIAFFSRIDEGDKMMEAVPQTTENIDKAVEAYGRTQEQAGGLDVGFIKQEKIKSASARQAALKAQQEIQVARKAVAEPAVKLDKPQAEPVTGKASPVSGIKQAMIDFKEKKYTSAFNNFMVVYGNQIADIRQGGSRYIKGALGLPPRYRAEILFLVEFERIRENSNNDSEMIKTGLQALFENIEGLQGSWVIVPEDKRTRIKRHITEFE